MEEQPVLFIQCKKWDTTRRHSFSAFLKHLYRLTNLSTQIVRFGVSYRRLLCWLHCVCWWFDIIIWFTYTMQAMLQLCDRSARSMDLIFSCKNLVYSKLELASMRMLVIYTVSQKKTRHQTLGHNFTSYYPIFKFFSLADSAVNLQQIHV